MSTLTCHCSSGLKTPSEGRSGGKHWGSVALTEFVFGSSALGCRIADLFGTY